ncbi:MAG: T9SS type A sorting domain-containing protein [Bacteroidales bacterium]|nr:T9SS type A sorting domain-containing protein [Bacteroidales bacterium]
MKKLLLTLLVSLLATSAFAGSILIEGFEYANHDFEPPIGWNCDDNSWLCGYLEKDHNRIPHTGNWYAFTDNDEAWMFMPMYLIPTMRYRFDIWAITDGQYSLSIWAGSDPNPESMAHQFHSEAINSQQYIKVSAYVEEIPEGCEYIGICATKLQGDCFLTIDDIEVDMVEQYTFEAQAITGDTAMYPGTQATFRFLIHNTGYDPVDVTVHPSDEYFTDFSFYSDGVSATTFPTQPDETVRVTVYATLRPEIEPGTVAWLDINMTIPCNCNTAMVTFWVTPLEPLQSSENNLNISIFPNPSTDFVTIETEDLQEVTLIDITGKTLSSVATEGNSICLDVSGLKAGVYFISAKTRSTSSFVKSILKM